jgi:uncharacterized SAM-binding protein YcdF (DUF218 family)
MSLDAIVVLGCRVRPDGRLIGASARRAAAAAAAWHATTAPLVIASGGKRWGEALEAEALAQELAVLGVDPAAIALESRSRNTLENARCCARILRARGARAVALVTCGWHMPRALFCFRALGIDPVPLPVSSPPAAPSLRIRRAIGERASLWLSRVALVGDRWP